METARSPYHHKIQVLLQRQNELTIADIKSEPYSLMEALSSYINLLQLDRESFTLIYAESMSSRYGTKKTVNFERLYFNDAKSLTSLGLT